MRHLFGEVASPLMHRAAELLDSLRFNAEGTERPLLTTLANDFSPAPHIDADNLFRLLRLERSNFQHDKDAAMEIYWALDFRGLHTGAAHMKGKSFYSDPRRTILRDPEPQDNWLAAPQESIEERTLKSSSSISYVVNDLSFGRKSFALMIRDDCYSAKEYMNEKSLLFALYGVISADGQLKISKIKAPEIERTSRISDVKNIRLGENNVSAALHYAVLCADKIQGRERFNARMLYLQAISDSRRGQTPRHDNKDTPLSPWER